MSESVAGAISRALRLSDAERTYLYRLLGISTTVSADFRADLGGSRLRHVVDEWMPSPALILDEFWNILDRNEAADEVFGLTARDTNLLASFFLNPEHRERYEDPATVARRAVAHFRSDIATALDDRRCAEVVDTLSDRSPEFAALWHDHEILDIRDRRKRMRHPPARPALLRRALAAAERQQSGSEWCSASRWPAPRPGRCWRPPSAACGGWGKLVA